MRALATLATCLALIAAPALAQDKFDPVAWEAAKPGLSVAVSPGSAAGQFVVKAVITDLGTAKVLARPVLITAAGQPAVIEMGSQGGLMVKLVVSVAADGRSASYVAELRKAGVLESSQASTVTLAGS